MTVDAHRKTLIRLSEDTRNGFGRVSAKGNFNKTEGKAPPFGGGDEEQQPFPQKGGSGGFESRGPGNAKRQIPENHDFDKKAIKPIVKSLWAMSVALGHALTAHRQFSRLKSSTFSPDGLLGGRGYVMPIKEIRQQLFEACENLSGLVDTLHDEISAPHWKPKLADLEKTDMAEVEKLLSDAEEWIDNPEEESEEGMEGVEGAAKWTKGKEKEDPKEHSDVPSGGDKETVQKSGPAPGSQDHPDYKHKQASATGDKFQSYDRSVATDVGPSDLGTGTPYVRPGVYAGQASRPIRSVYERFVRANSSVDPGTLPGPRVDHLDRGDVDQTGPGGSYNREDPAVTDDWGESGGVSGEPMSDNTGDSYAYPSKYDGQFDNKDASDVYNPHAILPNDPDRALGDRAKGDHTTTIEDEDEEWRTAAAIWGSSGVPDSNSDSTPTQGFDFGVGDGNGNDAHGQGAGGYGNSNPGSPDSNPDSGVGNQGVYGPRGDLPNDPGGATRDREDGDTIPADERGIGNNSVPHEAAKSEIPNDGEDPVARSDYYWGDKGNDFNYDKNRDAAPNAQSRQPGNNAPQPPAPSTARPMHLYEHEFAAAEPTSTSETPGDQSGGGTYDSAPGYTPDEYHRTEQVDQPYVTFDDNTHNMKPDETYQRGDLPAPYVNQDLRG